LNFYDQELTLNIFVVCIWKQGAPEKAEEPESEPRERTVTVSKLTEGLGLN